MISTAIRPSVSCLVIPSAACGSPQPSPESGLDRTAGAGARPRHLRRVGVYVTNEISGRSLGHRRDHAGGGRNDSARKATARDRRQPGQVHALRGTQRLASRTAGVDESTLPPPDRTADGIGVVDIRQQKLIKVLPSGTDPEQVAVSHDGTRVFVANEDAAKASVVDVATGKILETFRDRRRA